MKWRPYSLLILLLAILACNGVPARSYADLNIVMTTPHTSTYIWPVGAQMQLQALAVVVGGGATRMDFFANGQNIGNAAIDPSDDKPTRSINWTPSTVGEYYIQAQIGRPSGHSAMSNTVRVCVVDIGHVGSATPVFLWGYGYSGPCTIPPVPTVPRGTSTAVTISATADPVSLGYLTDSCPHPAGIAQVDIAVITFNATVNDPSGRVAFVSVRMLAGSGSSAFFDSLLLTQTGGGPTGTRTFSGRTVAMDNELARAFSNGTGTISWEARAIDRSGNVIVRDVHTMLVGPCEPPVHPLTSATDTPTPGVLTILPSPTFTPASAADCPPGTYYADVTHRCILIPSPTADNGGAVSCGKITSDSACNSTPGCTYNYSLKKCQKK